MTETVPTRRLQHETWFSHERATANYERNETHYDKRRGQDRACLDGNGLVCRQQPRLHQPCYKRKSPCRDADTELGSRPWCAPARLSNPESSLELHNWRETD